MKSSTLFATDIGRRRGGCLGGLCQEGWVKAAIRGQRSQAMAVRDGAEP
jgi:hypothetical protein